MRDIVPTPIIAVATFGNQTVNVRIPFEISSKSMENHDISCSAFYRILVTASGAETAMATKRNELKFSTLWAAIHSTAKRRITTVDHFFRYFPSHKIWDEEYI